MTPTDHAVAAMLDTFRRAPIERDYSDKDLRAALGSSPPLEKMKMGHMPARWPPEGCSLIWTPNDKGSKVTIRLMAPHYTGQGEPIAQYVEMEHAKAFIKAVNIHDELVAALERAQEEMRLIRMKDCGAVYDIGIRTEIAALLARAKVSHGAGT